MSKVINDAYTADEARWKGIWIGQDWKRDINPIGGRPIAFRKDYMLDFEPVKAVIKVSASLSYALWINGKSVSHGPARSFPKYQSYDEIDVSEFLVKGINNFAVIILPLSPMIGCSVVSRIGFILDGFASNKDENMEIFTDSSWKMKTAVWYSPMRHFLSLAAGFQEHYNANFECENWRTELPSDVWTEAWCIGPTGTPPWKHMSKRVTDLIQENVFCAKMIWKGKASKTIADLNDNLAIIFNEEVIEGCYTNANLTEYHDNRNENVYVFDFEKTRFVRPGIEITNTVGKLRVEIFYSLELTDRPSAMIGFESENEGFCDSIIPRQGNTAWEALYTRGFRFMTVKIVGKGFCKFKQLSKICEYPYPENAIFQSPDSMMNTIWKISRETILSSTSDALVDTCSREDNLWTLDACVAGKAAFYTFGDLKMWRRCLVLIAQGVDEDGIPKAVVPSEYTYMSLFDQAFHWVHSCWEYYLVSGDYSFLEEVVQPIDRLIKLSNSYITVEGLFNPPEYSWHWVDWAPINKKPYSLPINCLLLLASDATSNMAKAVSHDALNLTTQTISEKLRNGISRFYDNEGDCFKASIEPKVSLPDGNPMNYYGNEGIEIKYDLHGNSLACLTKCGTEQQRKNAMAFVVNRLGEQYGPNNKFGPGWTDILLSSLFEYGYEKEAVDFVKRVYGDFIEAGAPTWGEGFNAKAFNTAHAWGASVNSLIVERILGIRPLVPGWRKVLIDPHINCLDTFKYKIATPVGEILLVAESGKLIVSVPKGVPFVFRGEVMIGSGSEMEYSI